MWLRRRIEFPEGNITIDWVGSGTGQYDGLLQPPNAYGYQKSLIILIFYIMWLIWKKDAIFYNLKIYKIEKISVLCFSLWLYVYIIQLPKYLYIFFYLIVINVWKNSRLFQKSKLQVLKHFYTQTKTKIKKGTPNSIKSNDLILTS